MYGIVVGANTDLFVLSDLPLACFFQLENDVNFTAPMLDV